MSLWRCKGEQNNEIHNFIFHVGFPALKCLKNTCFTLDLEVGTFLYDMVLVSATYVQQFPSTSINPEKCQKTTISVREGSQLCTLSFFLIVWRSPASPRWTMEGHCASALGVESARASGSTKRDSNLPPKGGSLRPTPRRHLLPTVINVTISAGPVLRVTSRPGPPN